MAVTIVATSGSASANSFVTAAEMTTYCDGRLNSSAWDADDEDKVVALVEATRDITVMRFIGTRTDSTQALSWPRTWATDPDAPSLDLIGSVDLLYFADDEVPQRVKDATCELALQYLIAGTSDLALVDPNAGIISKTVDVLTTEWASPASRPTGLARFPRVLTLLHPLLQDAAGGLTLSRT